MARLSRIWPADKKVFIETEAEALALTQDGAKAVERLQGLGTQQEVALLAAEVIQDAASKGDLAVDRVTQLAAKTGLTLPSVTTPVTPVAEAEPAPARSGSTPRFKGSLPFVVARLGGGGLASAPSDRPGGSDRAPLRRSTISPAKPARIPQLDLLWIAALWRLPGGAEPVTASLAFNYITR